MNIKTIKDETDFVQRVHKLMEFLDENKLSLTYINNEFRISDDNDDNPRRKNCAIIHMDDFEPVSELPTSCEFSLKVFE